MFKKYGAYNVHKIMQENKGIEAILEKEVYPCKVPICEVVIITVEGRQW